MDTDIYDVYTYSSAAWLAIQGIPLAFYPQYVLSIAQVLVHDAPAVPATNFTLNTLRFLGGLLLSLSFGSLFITISAPPSQLPSPNEERTAITTTASTAPPALASVVLPLTTMLHATTSIWAYRQYILGNRMSFFLEMLGSGLIACMGLGAMLFGDESRPGRGSRWPFESKEAREKRKSKWAGRKERVKKEL